MGSAVIDDKALQLGTSMLSQFHDAQNESVSRFVFFWHEYEENGIFSQWHPTTFVIEGIRYATAEQYMMAKKALLAGDLRSYALIMNEPNPQKCKRDCCIIGAEEVLIALPQNPHLTKFRVVEHFEVQGFVFAHLASFLFEAVSVARSP